MWTWISKTGGVKNKKGGHAGLPRTCEYIKGGKCYSMFSEHLLESLLSYRSIAVLTLTWKGKNASEHLKAKTHMGLLVQHCAVQSTSEVEEIS